MMLSGRALLIREVLFQWDGRLKMNDWFEWNGVRCTQ